MSNLKLPLLTFENLSKLLGKRDAATIAYATTATRGSDGGIEIEHHGNAIAYLHPGGRIEIKTGGWDSKTTTMRLHRVCTDNETGYAIALRQGETVILDGETLKKAGWLGNAWIDIAQDAA